MVDTIPSSPTSIPCIKPLLFTTFTLATTGDRSPALPLPSQAQLNWHKAEYIMFAHFGMKTFYPRGDHMGYGKCDAAWGLLDT
jgi:hypothetical protein